MKCQICQFENPDDAKFCIECASPMEFHCPNCGAITPATGKFCKECAYDLRKPKHVPTIDYAEPQSYTPKHLADKILTTRSSIEGERKLVTVLFADVANYTSLSEKLDPEEVHQIMDGCFKILMEEIHKYEGTINQFTGDGVMALFGAPVSHEDHAQRTCRAALSVQKAMGEYGDKIQKDCGIEFKMRIGINSGPVIVGSIGDDLRMDYTAVGDTTNLAARMESMALPGSVLITANTHRLVRDFFEFEPLGQVSLKGKVELQEAYQLLRATELETRFEAATARGLTKFVGRRRELEALWETFEKACTGSGQVVGIVGEAGVGKSRLLLEMRNFLPEGAYTYLEGRCLHYGGNMPYLPALDILKSYFEIEEGDREFVIKKKMMDRLYRLNDRLKSALSPLQEILSLKVEDEKYLRLEPGQKKMRTFEAIRDLLVRDSENKPLVLAVEDLHWIDRTSEEFLSYLIDWLDHAHILLILLYRPEYNHQWGSKSYYSKIGVDQLSSKISFELVQAILEGGEVVPELRELVFSRAGGNPLFVEELAHSLLENGSIQRKDHQYVLIRDASEIQVPDTIQGIIASRIDRVEENLKRVMQVASVIGREFAFRILQTIMGMQEELKSLLLNLQGLELISEKRLFPELEYIFKHALTQEVAYNSLLQSRKREIHEKIGKAIESLYSDSLEEYYELLAYHYERSDNKDKAIEYLYCANQKAIRFNAVEDAKGYFDEAMKLLDTLPETEGNRERRISLIVNQFIVYRLLIKFPEYYDLLTRYEPVAVRLANQELLASFYARKGHCEYSFGYEDQAIQTGGKSAELAEASGNYKEGGYGYAVMEWAYMCKGNYDQALTFKKHAIRLLEKQFNPRYYTYALAAGSWVNAKLGRWEEAIKEGQEMLRVGEELSDDSLISFAGWILTFVFINKGDLSQAVKYGELSFQRAPTPQDKIWGQTGLAWAWNRLGEQRKGIEHLSQLVPVHRASRYVLHEVWAQVCLGEGYWLDGEFEMAKQTLKEAAELAERWGMRYYIGWAQRLLGEVALKVNPTEAPPHFEKSIAVLREIKAENELALAYAGYGRLRKQQGDIVQARVYLTKALEIFERLGTLIEPDKVREELAEISNNHTINA